MTTYATRRRDAVPFPPDPNPHPPRLAAPPGSWDCHFHVYGPPDRFPYAETRGFTPPAAPVEHWLRISAAIGIERGVLVTPAVHDRDPACTLDAIARSEGRIRGVVRAHPELAPAEIERLHRAGVRGVRFPFAKELGREFDAGLVRTVVPRIAPFGWVAQFHIDEDALEHHADVLGNLPTPVVLDGFAGVIPGEPLDHPRARALFDLLARPNVYLKLMCADREMHLGRRYADVVALSRAIVQRAPDRLLWGSDWPHAYVFEPGGVPNDGDLLDMLLDFAPDEAVRRQILAATPRRLWDVD